jgi:cyclopropane fatty-acyl-phospholipid synthase-like methyltransferase
VTRPAPPSDARQPSLASDAEAAKRYFGSFADDYQQAFVGGGRNPLHAVANRFFRRKTFVMRTEIVGRMLEEMGVRGSHVLEIGSGTGEVSFEAARLGAATVVGLDIAETMVATAQAAAKARGLQDRVTFQVADVLTAPVPAADFALLVGVIEYYADLPGLMARVLPHVRRGVVIADTRGPLWRRTIRYALARFKDFHLYYRSPDAVAAALRDGGFVERERHLGHSFSVLCFTRREVSAGPSPGR